MSQLNPDVNRNVEMTRWYTNHPIDQALQSLPDEVDPQTRLGVIWRAYEDATGEQVGPEPTEEQRAIIHKWICQLRATGTPPLRLVTNRPRMEFPVGFDIPSKVSSLTQKLCNACEPLVYADGTIPMILTMPIKVPPWSAQSMKSISGRNQVIKDAIRTKLLERPRAEPWSKSPICISIAAVVPHTAQTKDVDNLVKGLLDSLSGVLYTDDKLIQCLTTRRFEYAGDIGYYMVSARAVRPWSADVIYDNPKSPNIMSGVVELPEIEIKR